MPCIALTPVPTCGGPDGDSRCAYCEGVHRTERSIKKRRDSMSRLLSDNSVSGDSLTLEWTTRAERVITGIYEEMLGGVPDDWALVLCGSLARRQACPFSDIDAFIVVADEARIDYFVDISEKVKRRLIEAGGSSGFHFCDGGLEPTKITNTVAELVDFIRNPGDDGDSAGGQQRQHQATGMLESRFAMGNETLYREFTTALATTAPGVRSSKQTALNSLRNLVDDQQVMYSHMRAAYFVKDAIYRPVQLICRYVAQYYGITAVDTSAQIQELRRKGHMSPEVGKLFTDVLDMFYRTRVGLHLRTQHEDLPQGRTLPHAARQLVRIVAAELLELEHRQELVYPLVDLRGGQAAYLRGEADVLLGGAPRQHVV